MLCPFCKKEISKQAIASHIGSYKSEKKAQAARENGKKNAVFIEYMKLIKNNGEPMKIKKGTKLINPKPVICVVK